MAAKVYGKLIIVGKNEQSQLEFPIDKKQILVGRDHACDIRITNKEVSRKHAELYVEDNGSVFVNSMGREPVSVNGAPVMSPIELTSGDKIEVHLEGRTRIFYFHSNEDTVQVALRRPFAQVNNPIQASPLKKSDPKPESEDADNMPPPPPQLPVKQPEEEESQPEEVAPEPVQQAEEPVVVDRTEVIPDFDELPMIDQTEKVEFPVEEEMMVDADAEEEPALAPIAEEAMEEQQMEVDVAIVEEITEEDRALVAELVANAVNAAVAAAETVPVAEEEHEEEMPPADHPALIQEPIAPPSTAQKTKKSVRFTAMGTPEGAACDATAVLPFQMAGNADAVMVDDDTMAFAQWAGFSTEENPAETKQATPAPVPSARANRRKSGAPGSLAKTPVAPVATAAAATTPKTNTLASKLAELAEQHDVTFELPADFMKWTPGPAPIAQRLTIAVNINPRGEAEVQFNFGGDDNVAGPASAAKKSVKKSTAKKAKTPAAVEEEPATDGCTPGAEKTVAVAPRDLAAKLAELEDEHEINFELPVDFMKWTPAPATAGKNAINLAIIPRSAAKPASVFGTTPAKGTTPAGPGAQAPAPTPATAVTSKKSAIKSSAKSATVDPTSLAAKLAELAEEHEVDFDLPADFMRWTPAAKKAMSIAVTPRVTAPVSAAKSVRSAPRTSARKAPATTPAKSAAATPAAPGVQAPAPTPATAAKSVAVQNPAVMDPGALAAKLAELAEEHDVAFELPADFMRWTPAPGTAKKPSASVVIAPASAAKSQRSIGRSRMGQATEAHDGVEEVMQPVAEGGADIAFTGTLAASLEAVASARKTPASAKATPSRRRSSTRTPGTKIAIIGRNTPQSAAPSSVKPTHTPQETEEDVEMVEAAVEQQVAEEQVEAPAAAEAEESGENAEALPEDGEEEEEYEFTDEEELEEMEPAAEGAGAVRVEPLVPMADYRRVMLQARVHRARAVGLAAQLRGVSARALRLKKAAAGLATALKEERAKREELQNTLQRIIANREAQEAEENASEEIVEDDAMDCDEQECVEEPQEEQQPQQRVVIVGYNPAPQPVCTEMAGCVVVVRPVSTTPNAETTPAKPVSAVVVTKTPATSAKTSRKTPATSKKSARKTPGGGRILDDVEVPDWVFNGQAAPDVSAELAEVAAAEDAERRDEDALKELQMEVAAEVEAVESEEEEEMQEAEEADVCYKCNAGEEGDVLLLCDGCEHACHLGCCNPPKKRVPKGDWFCDNCKAKREEEAAAKKAATAKSRKRAAAEEKPEQEKKAPAKKTSAAPKRGRAAATAEEEAPAPKRTRGRQAAAPAAEAAAPKRSTRSRK